MGTWANRTSLDAAAENPAHVTDKEECLMQIPVKLTIKPLQTFRHCIVLLFLHITYFQSYSLK